MLKIILRSFERWKTDADSTRKNPKPQDLAHTRNKAYSLVEIFKPDFEVLSSKSGYREVIKFVTEYWSLNDG